VFPRRFYLKLIAAESRTLMDKSRPSRKQHYRLFGCADLAFVVVASGMIGLCPRTVASISLSHSSALKIGQRVWQNECNGTVSGLTSWNQGEDFASLGIGHFIWYPKGRRGPFEESFPKVVSFISSRGAKLPAVLLDAGAGNACPWNSRAEFVRAQHSVEMNQLRRFLADTIDLQAEFLVARLEAALPKMLAEAAPTDRLNVQQQIEVGGCFRCSKPCMGTPKLKRLMNSRALPQPS